MNPLRNALALTIFALGTALAEMKAAREDLVALEKVMSQED